MAERLHSDTAAQPKLPAFSLTELLGAWRSLAPAFVLVLALLLVLGDTTAAMVGTWLRSETYTHALLVAPITLWLVWRRRAELASLPVRPGFMALLPAAAMCGLWLMGALASVNAATQLALVALIVLAVPTVYGWTLARAITFPLLFLFFAVPIGDFLVPQMMDWTADFTVWALQHSGIPVYREGMQFVIPSGNWSVVEACSGVRYLMASFMVGTLFAYLNFQSTRRRVLFILLSLLVPIVANWVRAYLIVMLGHLSNNKLAAGVDHIVYGWVFFGVVIGLMFMVGARWSEPDPPAPVWPAGAAAAGAARVPAGCWAAGAALLLLVLATQGVAWQLGQGVLKPVTSLVLPAAFGAQWNAQPEAAGPARWVPAFQGASAVGRQSYSSTTPASAAAVGQSVGVWIGYYRGQAYDRKMVTSTNALVMHDVKSPWSWVTAGQRPVIGAGDLALVRTATLRGPADADAPAGLRLRVWQVYWVGGRWFTSDAQAKVWLALQRLRGNGDDAAVVVLYTPVEDDHAVPAADARLQRFSEAAVPPLHTLLDAVQSAR